MDRASKPNYTSRRDIIGVQATEYAGLGVFARERIRDAEILERTIAIPILEREVAILEATGLWEYYFVDRPELGNTYIGGYIVFGLSSICNHSYAPNADLVWMKQDGGVWVELRAKKPIETGEEVTIYYQNVEEYVGYGKIPNRAQA